MEITITTRPAGSEQRAASSEQPPELLTATPSLLTEPWRRPVWTFTGSTEAAVPQNSSLNVLTLLWKITAEPSRLFLYSRPEKSIRDKKEFTTTTCSDSPVGFSCACFLCFNFTVLLCYWAFINCWCRRTHPSFYKCVHPYYWELYCTSNITPLTDTLTIV